MNKTLSIFLTLILSTTILPASIQCTSEIVKASEARALKKLKVKPEEAMYVEDELEADYKGAKNVGMHALLIDRTEKQQSDFRTIKNLRDVLPLTGDDILEE